MTLFDDVAPALRTLAADGWRLAAGDPHELRR
jgi:hypothetical protein